MNSNAQNKFKLASFQLHHYGPSPSLVSTISTAFEVLRANPLSSVTQTAARRLLLKLKTDHINGSLMDYVTCVT